MVFGDGRAADEGFDRHPGAASLDGRDRAFALNLVATTLRRLGQIDTIVAALVERPIPRRGAQARNLIRLGVCQLAFFRTRAHAAVDTAVELARTRGPTRPYAGLVNAVLRRAAGVVDAVVADQDAPRMNTPDWLWRTWSAAYGESTARAVAAAHLSEPPLDLTLKGGDAPAGLDALRLPTGSLRLRHKGPVPDLPGFAAGAWWVQDAAAALPATLFGPVQGSRVIDLCAAPGGKTAQLCAAGADVVAVEHNAQRGRQLQGNLARLGLAAELVVADAGAWRPAEPADAVLLDAPCSATGAIRRHPDVAWLKTPAAVAALAAIQRRLLNAAVEMTRPGGTLIYCVCSLQPEEGPALIEALLESAPSLERRPVSADEIGDLAEAITPAGDVRTLPCHWPEQGGLDGFYIARLRRI
ncbi:MAG: MFS transporter [Rhodospirillales bacterium]|nr:MFS transporter [Rhodospirillales bacterium]